jgi:hypothetical protein
MRFNISFTSVVLIVAPDIDTAVQMVVDHAFDPGDASMPIVLDVEALDDEEEEEGDLLE